MPIENCGSPSDTNRTTLESQLLTPTFVMEYAKMRTTASGPARPFRPDVANRQHPNQSPQLAPPLTHWLIMSNVRNSESCGDAAGDQHARRQRDVVANRLRGQKSRKLSAIFHK